MERLIALLMTLLTRCFSVWRAFTQPRLIPIRVPRRRGFHSTQHGQRSAPQGDHPLSHGLRDPDANRFSSHEEDPSRWSSRF